MESSGLALLIGPVTGFGDRKFSIVSMTELLSSPSLSRVVCMSCVKCISRITHSNFG